MTSWCFGNLPYEFDPEESEVKIDFDASPSEPKTFDYPGSSATVEITGVTRIDTSEELDFDSLPVDVQSALVNDVWGYLETLSERD